MKYMAICVVAFEALFFAWCGYKYRVPIMVAFGLMLAFTVGVGFMELGVIA